MSDDGKASQRGHPLRHQDNYIVVPIRKIAHSRLELFDIARLASNQPLNALFEEPQRSVHRRLKDAVEDGRLNVSNMRGTAPNILSVVRRKDLRAYAQVCQYDELLAFLRNGTP